MATYDFRIKVENDAIVERVAIAAGEIIEVQVRTNVMLGANLSMTTTDGYVLVDKQVPMEEARGILRAMGISL